MALLNRLLISKAIYKENCFSIDCDQCSVSLKLFLPSQAPQAHNAIMYHLVREFNGEKS